MSPSTEPEMVVAMLAVMLLVGFGICRLFLWIRDSPTSPDPWGPEIERSLREDDATPVCHKCFTPQPPSQWFCEHCGTAVGDYNNLMPYVCLFSEGEVLRNGVTAKIRVNAVTFVGYLLLSLAVGFWPTAGFLLLPLLIFVAIYWYLFFTNLKRIKNEASHQNPVEEAG
jgi:hypothetical protein